MSAAGSAASSAGVPGVSSLLSTTTTVRPTLPPKGLSEAIAAANKVKEQQDLFDEALKVLNKEEIDLARQGSQETGQAPAVSTPHSNTPPPSFA